MSETETREHYVYVNMRDVGCNSGERAPTDVVTPAEREAWFATHVAPAPAGDSGGERG